MRAWPKLDHQTWRETARTLHLWTQIIGKVRLAATSWLNHSWHAPLYVTARGLAVHAAPMGAQALDMEFDFIAQRLTFRSSGGEEAAIALEAQTVARFFERVMATLARLGAEVRFGLTPNEIADAVPFPHDHAERAYNPEAALRFWRALVQAHRVFTLFRTGFVGKASPPHFFWGSFDLAVTLLGSARARPPRRRPEPAGRGHARSLLA